MGALLLFNCLVLGSIRTELFIQLAIVLGGRGGGDGGGGGWGDRWWRGQADSLIENRMVGENKQITSWELS